MAVTFLKRSISRVAKQKQNKKRVNTCFSFNKIATMQSRTGRIVSRECAVTTVEAMCVCETVR